MSRYNDPSSKELLMHQHEYKYPIPAIQDLMQENFEDSIKMPSNVINLAYFAKHLCSDAIKLAYWNKDVSYFDTALDFMIAALDYAKHFMLTTEDLGVMDIKEYGTFKIAQPLKYLEQNPLFWIDSMGIARIRGNKEALQSLAKVNTKLFQTKVGQIGGRADLVAAYTAYLRGDNPTALQHFQKAAGVARKRGPGHFQSIDLPISNTMIQLLSNADQETMEAYLFTTFSAHRSYYDKKKGLNRGDSPMKDSFEAVFPLRQIALLTLIREHFPNLDFKTGYSPDWLFE